MQEDGSGNLTWNLYSQSMLASSTPLIPLAQASTTIYSAVVPANTLIGDNSIRVRLFGLAGNTGPHFFEFAYGNSTTTLQTIAGTASYNGTLEFDIQANGSAAQNSEAIMSTTSPNSIVGPSAMGMTQKTSTVDATQNQNIIIVYKGTNASASLTTQFATTELIAR